MAAGAGDRDALSPEQSAMANSGVKAMIPIGRPFLDYALSAAADAGLTDVCLVIGPEHESIRDYYSRVVTPQRIRVDFCIQAHPIGTADAVLAAQPFVGNESFVVVNADNYYPAAVLAALRAAPPPALPAFTRDGLLRDGLIPPERIAHYALLEIGDDGILRRIVEKPDPLTASLHAHARVSMNCWLLTPDIFEACRRVEVSSRGEVELPLAVQFAIDMLGARFTAIPMDAAVLDLSRRTDIPGVAAQLATADVRL